MDFRSMFSWIFGSEKNPTTEQARLLNGYNNVYTPWDGNAYDDATVRDCVDTIARHFGKMKPKHVLKRDGKIQKTVDGGMNYLLSTKPNELMTASEFLEKFAAQYLTYNNAFIYPERDSSGKLVSLWPLNFADLELREYEGQLYCRFTFGSGQQTTVPYSDIVHVRRYFNRDDIWGDGSVSVLKDDLTTLKAVRTAIVNAVSNFGALRGILKWKQSLRPEDEKAAWQRFIDTYASTTNGSGIGSLDNKAEFQQINTPITTFDSSQMEYVRNNIYRHFGLNDKIITGQYNENEYIAFYESVLEPIAVKLAQELTDKLFTERERGWGNEIVLESNRLSYMSVASKIKVCAALTPIGCISINEVREMFGYAGVDGGDERQVSLNYVKAGDQSVYQVGTDSPKGGEQDEGNKNDDSDSDSEE
jgi:HK97 family phage portal protein